MKHLSNVKYVVTHPGKAHRDDYLSCAILFVVTAALRIFRREPTPQELDDKDIMVVDTGMQYNPELLNFDHHQLPRDADPECALSQLVAFLGLTEEFSLKKWFGITVMMDAKGPFAVSKHLELPRFPFELLSPIEGCVLGAFEKVAEVTAWDPIGLQLRQIGGLLLDDVLEYAACVRSLEERVIIKELRGVNVLIVEGENTRGIEDFRERKCPGAGVLVAHSDREGEGWLLYRFEDHPRVDFSGLGGREDILFAHNGGFIAKTADREKVSLSHALMLVDESIK